MLKRWAGLMSADPPASERPVVVNYESILQPRELWELVSHGASQQFWLGSGSSIGSASGERIVLSATEGQERVGV